MSQTKANKDAPQPKVIRGMLPQEEMPQEQLELAKRMGSGSNSTDFCELFEAIKTVMRAGGHDDGLFQGTVDGKPPELEFAVKVMKEAGKTWAPLTLWPLFEELPGLGRRDRTRDRDIARGQHYRVASDDRSANPKKAANAKETGSSKTAKEMKHLETKRWLADAKGCVHQSAVSASPANFLALFSTAWNFADKQNEGCASIVYGGVVMSKDGTFRPVERQDVTELYRDLRQCAAADPEFFVGQTGVDAVHERAFFKRPASTSGPCWQFLQPAPRDAQAGGAHGQPLVIGRRQHIRLATHIMLHVRVYPGAPTEHLTALGIVDASYADPADHPIMRPCTVTDVDKEMLEAVRHVCDSLDITSAEEYERRRAEFHGVYWSMHPGEPLLIFPSRWYTLIDFVKSGCPISSKPTLQQAKDWFAAKLGLPAHAWEKTSRGWGINLFPVAIELMDERDLPGLLLEIERMQKAITHGDIKATVLIHLKIAYWSAVTKTDSICGSPISEILLHVKRELTEMKKIGHGSGDFLSAVAPQAICALVRELSAYYRQFSWCRGHLYTTSLYLFVQQVSFDADGVPNDRTCHPCEYHTGDRPCPSAQRTSGHAIVVFKSGITQRGQAPASLDR